MKLTNLFTTMKGFKQIQLQSQKQKMTILTKGIIIAAGSSILGLSIYFSVMINTADVKEAKAEEQARLMMGYEIGEGEVIASFTWDEKNTTKAAQGSDALYVSPSATVTNDGSNETNALSAGTEKKDINLEIQATSEFNSEGIDISFDFRRMEESCDFYSRGNYFNFGMRNGKIIISYKAGVGDGKGIRIADETKYEIPMDNEFRNYRFLYNPQKGKAEIFVNGVTIWSHEGPEQAPLLWKSSDNIVIGRGMNGDGSDKAILDNLVIRSTSNVDKIPVRLLNFEAKAEANHVMIRWFTAKEVDTDTFLVERSINGTDFIEIGRVKAAGNSNTLNAYALVDKNPVPDVASYYRLVPANKPIKSITVPVIGYKFRKDHIENMPMPEVEAKVQELIDQKK
ncbi:MAG: hypothetical protein ACHQNT_02950 [Bacteroidia bacterium]